MACETHPFLSCDHLEQSSENIVVRPQRLSLASLRSSVISCPAVTDTLTRSCPRRLGHILFCMAAVRTILQILWQRLLHSRPLSQHSVSQLPPCCKCQMLASASSVMTSRPCSPFQESQHGKLQSCYLLLRQPNLLL